MANSINLIVGSDFADIIESHLHLVNVKRYQRKATGTPVRINYKSNMNKNELRYGPLYEDTPLVEKTFPPDTPEEGCKCEDCVFNGSVRCYNCPIR